MKLPTLQQINQTLTGFGALLAAIGTLPIDSADLPMPPHWRPYIISIGFFSVVIGKWIKIILDWMDNGKIDGSVDQK